MKKIYEQPIVVLNVVEVEDILTGSGNTLYSSRTTVDENNVYDLKDFI